MDSVKKFLAHNKRISVICANTKELVEEIRKIHDLTPTTTAVMGRFATISGIMGFTDIKENDDVITIQIKGEGPIGTMVSVVRRDNNVSLIKSYMDDSSVELPLKNDGKIDVGGAVGKTGFLNIIKKNKFDDQGYNGLIPLVSGEIAEDFTEYFAKSEQKPTVLALGVLVDKDGVRSSGGYMINLMPDATEEEIQKIEKALENAPSISQMLFENRSLEDIAKTVTGDEKIELLEEDLHIKFECDCNKKHFERGLISIGKDDLEKILLEDKKANIICHFCNKEYDFTEDELRNILEKITK